jgi:hypothetical protein
VDAVRTANEGEVAMTDQTGSVTSASTPPGTGWRKSRHSNPDGSCLEVTVMTGPYLRAHGRKVTRAAQYGSTGETRTGNEASLS